MPHILINALSMGSGGGFTVGRELLRHVALARPGWAFTAALIESHHLHEQLRKQVLPSNCRLTWAPASTMRRAQRNRWERKELADWARTNRIDACVQLNGMLVPTMPCPTLCHMQDPWPYRPQAWLGLRDRFIALLKRRQHKQTLEHAAAFGWTSEYLRELICGYHGIWPKLSEVLYNGVPDAWIERAGSRLPAWEGRRDEIVTVSNVNAYKRQELVIRAMPLLIRKPGLGNLKYRIVGQADPPELRDRLSQLASELDVSDRVTFEGRIGDEALRERFANAKAFVLMSVCESFGIPAIEAMSFGTPVITADCCAMPEVCGDAAELAPVDQVEPLAARIASVLLDPDRAEQLRRRGAERVARFSWTEVASKMAALLEKILPSDGVAK